PTIAHDLRWKTERGATELSRSTEFAVVLGEPAKVREAAASYLKDEEVSTLIVIGSEGQLLLSHPDRSAVTAPWFLGEPGKIRETAATYAAWQPIEIEGAEVGRVALGISKQRLAAGAELRSDILKSVAVGCLVAFLVAVFFVYAYIGPLVRVTHRAFADLEQRTREALESARLKSEFLANMSHEVRTPMNGVIGMAELLGKTELSKKQRRYARTILSSASALLTIINDILDFSKIEAGKMTVRPVETDVRRLSEEVTQLLAPQAQAKGIDVLCAIDPEVPREVLVDHDRLRQVLNNVMGNAVKFTNQGSVVLRVWQEQQAEDGSSALIAFSVKDTGIGIAPEDHQRVFELFSQVDGSLTRSRGGTGLGLSISKHLVELMGGTLSLESELGRGSDFTFTVRAEVLAGVGSRPPQEHMPRTLIVDDNETNRTVLEEVLDAWGVHTDSARSADEALQLIRRANSESRPFGLALLDQKMPGMNGTELARRIRVDEGERAPRLVLVTSLSDSAQVDEVFDDGLAKPILQDDLRRVLTGSNGRASASERELLVGSYEFIGRPRLLVAEDNAINREVMREILAELEIDCDMAENGQEAMEMLERAAYPVVLMDCQMPELDGYEATRRIRRWDNERAHVPIIAVTAHAVLGERDKAISAGMTDYVTKPVTITRLSRVLARFLDTRKRAPSLVLEDPREDDEPLGSTPTGIGAAVAAPSAPEESPATARAAAQEAAAPAAPQEAAAPAPRPAAPAATAAATPTVTRDPSVSLDGGVKRSATVVGLFLKMVPAQLEALQQAVRSANAAEARAQAHKLKGGCLAIGAYKMGSLCAQLEPHPENRSVLFAALNVEYMVVRKLLEAEQAEKRSTVPS
ncbi:MAG TPA: response regulator, partial [Polyangiaceae bacterium]|nr:response regulator [Polyangiaceae bacterium]